MDHDLLEDSTQHPEKPYIKLLEYAFKKYQKLLELPDYSVCLLAR